MVVPAYLSHKMQPSKVQQKFGMGGCSKPKNFFGFLFLPPFNHPYHLKSELTTPSTPLTSQEQ